MSKVLSNERVTPRLFKNNLLEAFSKVSWYVPMLLYLPVVTVSLYFSFSSIKFGLVFLFLLLGFLLGHLLSIFCIGLSSITNLKASWVSAFISFFTACTTVTRATH